MRKNRFYEVLYGNDRKKESWFMILLFISVSLLIVFAKQELIIIPEYNKTLKGEDKVLVLDYFSSNRWRAFVISPVLTLLRVLFCALSMFIGSFFFS